MPSTLHEALATDLHNQLTQNDDSNSPALRKETHEKLQKVLDRLPLLADSFSASTRRQLDNEGTKLWNVRLLRVEDVEERGLNLLLCKGIGLFYRRRFKAELCSENTRLCHAGGGCAQNRLG